MRKNIGYDIVKSERYNKDYEIVLGAKFERSEFVTWECKAENDYFWGHYFTDYATALKDYHTRLAKYYDEQIEL